MDERGRRGAHSTDEAAEIVVDFNPTPSRLERLSPRERSVAMGIARGEAYKVVAMANALSVQSVSTYLTRAKKKLRVKSRADLIRALSPAMDDGRGESRSPPDPKTIDPCPLSGLSGSERDVLGHLLCGLSNAQVATSLGIRPRTVAAHASTLMRKLRVESRAELIAHYFHLDQQQTKWIRDSANAGHVEEMVIVGKVTMAPVDRPDVLFGPESRPVVVAPDGLGKQTDE